MTSVLGDKKGILMTEYLQKDEIVNTEYYSSLLC